MISFEVDPALAAELAWIREFVATEIEPLDLAFGDEEVVYDKAHPVHDRYLRPLQERVRERGLWSCHLTREFGGQGYGQVQLALMNEILGRSAFAPTVFGCQAPDSGNAEILAHYGTLDQRERYLKPLLDGEISSCYAMTEPQGGADPALFTTRAARDGDRWVIDGEKWFSSSFEKAAFTIVMAVTNPDVPVYQGTSMFLVPAGTPGLEVIRRTGLGYDAEGTGNHPYVRYDGVAVPAENLLGGEGQAFVIAQTRLGGGRLHHAMRTVGAVARCLDMLCERALSRTTQGELLARKQLTQQKIAEAWVELTQFRLQVLHAAWCVDTHGAKAARREIAGVKVATPKVYHNAVLRTMHAHGALGISNEMPLARMLLGSVALGIADGPTEVHQATLARDVLKEHRPSEGAWPSEHLPARRQAARARYASLVEG
ncbi:acyl-CoA dehydrogenase family protein [Frankia sp. CNm7]|uniref:Acyl-CoA dehydrogenase family protein n=1 Tax=Frankia nepalensis TaxID=1836974 RepID=A0A937RHP8_9ACTN|nr:acyl-CoA dehydrogenase family protein [Frankia nepalensis]MBL7502062.1 acyl-CoA dehydrogenase family protein [Frankia nepalensis]MBL7511968.1 acyl-CoA dehydrogenase family protein [Frankia nepalensis]MBL7524042.1 acyl-CoA dehydrogenase family protein [Frankia nepalensis]MBL7630560.1 acyl-CoA dehydrogenase family protein [Frankia nepalensis]